MTVRSFLRFARLLPLMLVGGFLWAMPRMLTRTSVASARKTFSPIVHANSFSLKLNPAGPAAGQFMRVPPNGVTSSLNITGSLTVEAWIKPDGNAANLARAIVARFPNSTTPNAGYFFRLTSSNQLKFTIYNGGSKSITGGTVLTNDNWYHVAGVYDSAQQRLSVYVNGRSDAAPVSSAIAPGSVDNGLRVGASSDATDPILFTGNIDEVRVTADAVYQSNFDTQLQPSLAAIPNCRGLWKFDNQDGTDSSVGNNNRAPVFEGGPSFSTDVPGGGTAPPNQPPVARVNGPYSGAPGATITFSSAGSADPEGSPLTFDWDFGDSTVHSTLANPTHAYGVGNYMVTLTVRDSANLSASASTTANVASGNQPPMARVNGPYAGTAGASIAFSSFGTSDPEGAALTYDWDFGDGTQHSALPNPTHVYNGARTYTVTLTVKDDALQQARASTSATINAANQPPVAEAGGPYTGTTATPVSFSSAGSSDPEGSLLSYDWDFGDGTAHGTAANPSHSYNAARNYTATLTVRDSGGLTGTDTAAVTVTSGGGLINVARASNGGVASASSSYFSGGFPPSGVNDGDRKGLNWASGGGWNDDTYTVFPDWLQVAFNGSKTISEIDVITLQDNFSSPIDPTPTMTFSQYGIVNYDVQYWNAGIGNWSTVPNGSVTSNNKVWRQFTFAPITTDKIRVNVTNALNGFSRVAELEAWGNAAGGGGGGPATSFGAARVDPVNRTGTPGEDLYSGNYQWSLPLLRLTGRAGLDLGLSLSYNSLVWTKAGSSIKFDADLGYPGPGFRLGFPAIEAQKFTSESGSQAYLLILPSGSHVELRQIGGSALYESFDSSYLQFDTSTNPMILRTADGTQMSYAAGNNVAQLECTQIKDRNGNYITIGYNTADRLSSVVDTLGRTVNFVYYPDGTLQAIRQLWGATPHDWATFTYASQTLSTNFQPATVAPASFLALSQVTLDDGMRVTFDYTFWGQVSSVSTFAADNHLLNSVTYNLPQTNALQLADCPRFSERRDFAETWNNGVAAVTTFGISLGGGPGQITLPDQTTSMVETFETSAWKRGLTQQIETRSFGVTKKTTLFAYEQDDESLSYKKNPRVKDVRITDNFNNIKRTSTTYVGMTLPSGSRLSLPADVTEYLPGGVNPLRRVHIDYNTSSVYLNRHILGLPAMQFLFDGAGTLFSQVEFAYDWPGAYLVDTVVATNHDQSYNAGFVAGRGNLVGIGRHSILPNDPFAVSWTQTGYDINGSVKLIRDNAGHGTDYAYEDSFFDRLVRSQTLAYPTTISVTDGPATYRRLLQHHYDLGTPARVEDPKGAIQVISYDNAGRVKRTDLSDGGYTRFEHPASQTEVLQYRAISAGVEALSLQRSDGAGRVIGTARNHPGSVGGYRGVKMIYDVLGRRTQTSNPAEINSPVGVPVSAWTLAGDDVSAGWNFTRQDYDWNDRVTGVYNQDNTSTTPSRTTNYDGCGCAGGDVETRTDEAGRRVKIYHDVLGREVKVEILNLNQSVYSTTVNTYNVRDQITNIRQIKGTNGSFQDTVLTYDGHGRLASRKAPSQSKATLLSYTPNDDTLLTLTDARNAETTYSYNARHLLTGITHTAPAGVEPTPDVTFDYDGAGNRTKMTDGAGSVIYTYDTWSRLKSETRQFNGLLTRSFSLTYDYDLASHVTRVTDPYGSRADYAYDAAGQVIAVTGGPSGSTQYARQIGYRAWGAIKQVAYGNPRSLSVGYNARLLATTFDIPNFMSKTYDYYPDGLLKSSHDLRDARLDRSYGYDHVGRLTQGLSGSESRGGAPAPTSDRPYRQTYQYDEFNHLTRITNAQWSVPYTDEVDTFVNNRDQRSDYDNEGNVTFLRTSNLAAQYALDAESRVTRVSTDSESVLTYDGDGIRVKSIETFEGTPAPLYYIPSSVFGGQILTETYTDGSKKRSFVYLGGTVLATQWGCGGSCETVSWVHSDPSGASYRTSNASGLNIPQGVEEDPAELTPFGSNARPADPFLGVPPDEDPGTSLIGFPNHSDPRFANVQWQWNGIPISMDLFMIMFTPGRGSMGGQFAIRAGYGLPGDFRPSRKPGFAGVWIPDRGEPVDFEPRVDQTPGSIKIGTSVHTIPGHWEWTEEPFDPLSMIISNAIVQETASPGQLRKLTNDPTVRQYFYDLWTSSGSGAQPTERAGWILQDPTTGQYGCKRWPWTAETARETWKGAWPANMIALAHTHPDNKPPQPSTGGKEVKGDDYAAKQINAPVYTITRQGIWKIDPSGTITQEADRHWWEEVERAVKGKTLTPCLK